MGYYNTDSNTRVYFANGMINNKDNANKSAKAISDLINQPVGTIVNDTHGLIGDVKEYIENSYKMKDILNEYTYRTINNNTPQNEKTTIITHSAGNEDMNKAISLGVMQGYNYPNIQVISAGSPTGQNKLSKTLESGGAKLIGQVNDWKDPVTHSKTIGTLVLSAGGLGAYYGSMYMPILLPPSEILTQTALGKFLIDVGSIGVGTAVGIGVGAGVSIRAILKYHPFEKYLEKPELQNMIKDSIFKDYKINK